MKCRFFSVCLALTLALPLAASAASEFYVNDAVINCPPQIPPQVDATNFVNNNYFSINFTNALFNPPLYKTANTLNFTNLGYMFANFGFQFDTGPSGAGTRKMANNFVNSGTIAAGSIINDNLFFNFFFGGFFLQSIAPKILISATNVTLNSSTTSVGLNGLFALTGKNVDLDRANILMEGFADNLPITSGSNFFFFNNVGIFDAYWGVGTNVMVPPAQFTAGIPTTPPHLVISPAGFLFQQLSLPAAVPYVEETVFDTNRFVQVVFLSNTNDAILNNVYFPFTGNIVVEWLAPRTNLATGEISTNYLYLQDNFGSLGSNILVQSTFNFGAQPRFIPINYSFFRGGPFNYGTPAPSGLDPATFDFVLVTNDYAAYSATLAPTTQEPGYIIGSVITNLPGRTEIIADGVLNMTHANIEGLNYLRLRATNHFAGSEQAQIVAPFSDIALTTTNGILALTNLLSPTVPRFTGTVDLWSGRWTNDAGGFRSIYHVLFVDSQLSPTAPAQIQDLVLRTVDNIGGGDGSILISDVLNITRSMMLDAERITITTNASTAPTRAGEINLLSTDITWPGSTPRLEYLTNAGTIRSGNAVFFGGSRTAPHYSSNFNEPYIAFVNRGTVSTEGSLIWADYFENSGFFNAGLNFGSITLESQDTRLTNGSFLALRGDISIKTGNLVITNYGMQAGRKIILNVREAITDTGASNANNWVVGRGFDLLVKPPTGDLLGTTISETAPAGVENIHNWAGEDRGATVSGFANNVALGRVILSGGSSGSLFTFRGVGPNQNALYVDHLDLRNFATNINASGNLSALRITNMVIYYAQATAGGISIAERINQANGGRLRWVPEYAGTYSSTNLVYPDGTTNSFNAALVQSQNIDSDGDGLVNANDPTPILRPQDLALTVAVTSQPVVGATVSWNTVPSSSNTIYYKASSGAGSWQVLTNLNVGPSVSGRVSVFDPMSTNGGRYYRVMMSPPQP